MRKKAKIADIIITVLAFAAFIGSVIFLLDKLPGLPERIYIQISPNGEFTKMGDHTKALYAVWIGAGALVVTTLLSIISYPAIWSKKLNERGNEILSTIFIILLSFHKIAFVTYCVMCNISIALQKAMIKGPSLMVFGFLCIAWILFMGTTAALYKACRNKEKLNGEQ